MTEISKSNPEREPTPVRERIELYQRFHPFAQNRTTIRPDALQLKEGENHPMFRVIYRGEKGHYAESHIILPLEKMLVRFRIAAAMQQDELALSFVPFSDPYIGYRVGNADFHLEEREIKNNHITINEAQRRETDLKRSSQDSLQHPLLFQVLSEDEISPELASRLRLQVSAARFQFEAAPYTEAYKAGLLHFISFYPRETGPLATTGDATLDEEKGTFMHLPVDANRLASMTARFHVATDLELAFEKSQRRRTQS